MSYALVAAPGLVVVAVGFYAYSTYATWGTFGSEPPPRIDWCWRRYYPSSETMTFAQVTAEAGRLREVARSPAGYRVLAAPMTPAQQASFHTDVCTMILYLELGPDTYRPYELSGGP